MSISQLHTFANILPIYPHFYPFFTTFYYVFAYFYLFLYAILDKFFWEYAYI